MATTVRGLNQGQCRGLSQGQCRGLSQGQCRGLSQGQCRDKGGTHRSNPPSRLHHYPLLSSLAPGHNRPYQLHPTPYMLAAAEGHAELTPANTNRCISSYMSVEACCAIPHARAGGGGGGP